MSPVHRWTLAVGCPSCGKTGEISVVEDAGPPFTDQPRLSGRSDEGFHIASDGILAITCPACGAVFGRDPA